MKIKNKVQNPLTIIAIFAGIAEVVGTAVLLGLPLELQKIFVWFVMLFPLVLVMAFFCVLLFKSNVLYAPGDFNDEKHYMELQRAMLKNATEIIEEIKADVKPKTLDVTSEKEEVLVSVDKLNGLLKTLNNLKEELDTPKESETFKYIKIRNNIISALIKAGDDGLTMFDIQLTTGMPSREFIRILTELINSGLAKKVDERIYYVPLER